MGLYHNLSTCASIVPAVLLPHVRFMVLYLCILVTIYKGANDPLILTRIVFVAYASCPYIRVYFYNYWY